MTPPVVIVTGPVWEAGKGTVIDPMTISPDPRIMVFPPTITVDFVGPNENVVPPRTTCLAGRVDVGFG